MACLNTEKNLNRVMKTHFSKYFRYYYNIIFFFQIKRNIQHLCIELFMKDYRRTLLHFRWFISIGLGLLLLGMFGKIRHVPGIAMCLYLGVYLLGMLHMVYYCFLFHKFWNNSQHLYKEVCFCGIKQRFIFYIYIYINLQNCSDPCNDKKNPII